MGMSYVAVIVGISENERYLDLDRKETENAKRAKRFRSEDAARKAAMAHIEAFPRCVAKNMGFRVVPA